VVTAAGSLPSLAFTLWAGVVADRADKRRIILVADLVMGAQSLALAVLTHLGLITYPCSSCWCWCSAAPTPSRSPRASRSSWTWWGKEDLPNAIALNSAAFNGTRISGAGAGGVADRGGGGGGVLLRHALSFLFVVVGLTMMRLPPFGRRSAPPSTLDDLREGDRLHRGDRLVRTLVWLIAAMSITAFPYAMLLPVFARDVLLGGRHGAGVAAGGHGLGALRGAWRWRPGAGRLPRGRLMVWSSLAFCAFLSPSPSRARWGRRWCCWGARAFSMILNNATLNALLQSLVPQPAARGG
jgi:hypothetical protein